VVRLPAHLPAFFVPASRPLALDLRRTGFDAARIGHPVRFATWAPCLAGRLEPAWQTRRTACVAIGMAEGRAPGADTQSVALLLVTPGAGFAWSHLRLASDGRNWHVRRLWMGRESRQRRIPGRL
jgi:hypothetical protein